MRTRNWDKLYSTYIKIYEKKQQRSRVGMEEIYNKYEFRAIYTALETDRKLQIKKGQRKVANIMQDLVARQQEYKYSFKQAKLLKKRIKEIYNEDVSIYQIRLGKTGKFWEDVKLLQQKLDENGIRGAQARRIIASTFFGSL